MILSESKRDDMLLPYIELLKSKGIETDLRQFKGYMLKKLTNEGGMRNLSLSSNYYLAGAVRYYFNGDLTLNKDLDVFNNGTTNNDVWNTQVCLKLNALINILRNAYIDTIGETFEQPEDFGSLSLPKLLRKYNKKIDKELNGEKTVIDPKQEEDSLDRTPNVGNGYTFEILYSYNDATKYREYTDPGAWCITYGQQHYNSYIKRLGIHYVIFKQDGFESVPRVKGQGWTYDKPQDEYGCSLIALLQSNVNGEPVYITSRWNHGYECDTRCEADHAFSKEEFMEKTGVTDADLQRIFEIWKKDYKRYSTRNDSEDKTPISRDEKISVIRQLKYAQMRMNGGNYDIKNVFEITNNLSTDARVDEGLKINKIICACKTVFESEHSFMFLMDRGKIIFDTLIPCDSFELVSSSLSSNEYHMLRHYNNLIVWSTLKYIMLYDTRAHSLITVDGITKFKGIPDSFHNISGMKSKYTFYELRVGKEQAALLNLATNKPLMLPNGSYWINKVMGTNGSNYWGGSIGRTNLHSKAVGGQEGSILELIYDASSGERYLYNVDENRFISDEEMPNVDDDKRLTIYRDTSIPGYILFQMVDKNMFLYRGGYPPIIVCKNGQVVSINGHKQLVSIKYLGGGIISYSTEREGYKIINNRLYNLFENKPLILPNGSTLYHQLDKSDDAENMVDSRLIFIRTDNMHYSESCIYDKDQKIFIQNPINWPNQYTFKVSKHGFSDGSGVLIERKPEARPRFHYHWLHSFDENWREDYAYLYIPNTDMSRYEDNDIEVVGLPSDSQNNSNFTNSELHQMVREVVDKIRKIKK